MSETAASKPRDQEADDKSGIRDFEGPDRDRYIDYPVLMWSMSSYIRREITRLGALSDEDILAGRLGQFDSLLNKMDALPNPWGPIPIHEGFSIRQATSPPRFPHS